MAKGATIWWKENNVCGTFGHNHKTVRTWQIGARDIPFDLEILAWISEKFTATLRRRVTNDYARIPTEILRHWRRLSSSRVSRGRIRRSLLARLSSGASRFPHHRLARASQKLRFLRRPRTACTLTLQLRDRVAQGRYNGGRGRGGSVAEETRLSDAADAQIIHRDSARSRWRLRQHKSDVVAIKQSR